MRRWGPIVNIRGLSSAIRSGCGVRRFCNDEGGAAIAFFIMMLALMLVSTGMAVDYMRHEMYRAALQDALDRGVLAAASLSQTIDPEVVVADYLNTAGVLQPGTERFALSVTPATVSAFASGSRLVTATGTQQLDTYFLKLIGYPRLAVTATATAQIGQSDVEISLALDISGSMRFVDSTGTPRISRLKPAAVNFVQSMLSGSRANYTSISVIPYAGQVNIGQYLFTELGGTVDHAGSYCMELGAGDFTDTGLPTGIGRLQVPHFHSYFYDPAMAWGWCPSPADEIVVHSNDAVALTTKIQGLALNDGTGTNNAIKYAAALLDPSSQPTVADLADNGAVPLAFSDRPAAWSDTGTLKIIVLMTDGIITHQNRPTDPTNPVNATVELDRQPSGASQMVLTRDEALDQFYAMCDAAKASGVTIFTIAFEAPADAALEMRNCASSASHSYDVRGDGIEDAFQSIDSSITNLKLIN